MARWLLHGHDWVWGETFLVTQDFLATMLCADAPAQGATPREDTSRVMKDIEQWGIGAASLRRKGDHLAQVEPQPVEGSSWAAGLLHELRYALRVQRRQLKFAALVIGLTALGIGATAALFSVTYDVLVKPLPWPNADRVVSLTATRGGNTARVGALPMPCISPGRKTPDP